MATAAPAVGAANSNPSPKLSSRCDEDIPSDRTTDVRSQRAKSKCAGLPTVEREGGAVGIKWVAQHEPDFHLGRRSRTRAFPMVCSQPPRADVHRSRGDQPPETPRAAHRRHSPASSNPRSCRRAVNPRVQRNASTGRRGRESHSLRSPWATILSRESPTFSAAQREPRRAVSAFHRAMTSLYWALAFVTASISLEVGATSAPCIAIAAAIIAAPTLTRVGGPPGA